MKKLLLLLLLNFLIPFSNANSQNYNWITPNKAYLKMYVADDGVYRINRTDFSNAGINPASIDPRTIKVYKNGVEIPVFFSGEGDGSFDVSDYFDFYGTRNYGGVTQVYDHNNFPLYTVNDYYNQYSDTSVYWAGWGGALGQRMTVSNFTAGSNYVNQFFTGTVHFEKDYFYSQGEYLNSNDLRYLSTEKFRGEGWYWSTLFDNQTLSDTVSLPDLHSTPQNASIRVFAYPTNRNTSILNEHSIQIRVNGNLIITIVSNDMNRIDSTVTFSSSLLSSSTVNNISVKYVPNGGYSGSMYIDYFTLNYPKNFSFRNNNFTAKLTGVDTTSKIFRIKSYVPSGTLNIYDVKNNIRINTSTVSADTLKFTGKSDGSFEVVNSAITKKPLRMKQRSVPDLVSASNGADYLVIYPSIFTSQAEQLRAYRQTHDNFRSFKAEVEDIYDIFNYGMESPVAVRNFTTHAYYNWQQPGLKYICLLGRASLDPKKNYSTSSYYQNLVPTYGYPPSDGYFGNFFAGAFFYYGIAPVGRLPAYSVSEAQTMVDKIIAYENQKPDSWSKEYAYITGGGTINEQLTHQSKSNNEINSYIIPPALSGSPIKIYRTDTSGSPTFNVNDSVKNTISNGCLFVNYRGHAGSHDWEVALTDPNTLSNGNKLPLILSLTCFTGENSKSDYRGFGERFVYLYNKGAIGFIGTTGWSYAQFGNDFGTYMLQTFKDDTTRRVGNMLKYAQLRMSEDSLSFAIRHTINCYSLIGDPAVTLNLPVRPELSVRAADYKINNSFPTVGENITFKAYPKNYGLQCDSTKIRFQLKKDNVIYATKDTVIRNLKYRDSVSYTYKLDSIGNYAAVVTLDADNWIPLEDKTNNVLTVSIPVKDKSFVPFKPVANSVVTTDSVELVGLNPRILSLGNTIKVIAQLDTTKTFNSPLLKTFANSGISGVTTKFKSAIPAPVNNRLYYWRTNCIINGDSAGWSNLQHFIYNNTFPTTGAVGIRSETDNSGVGVSVVKLSANQYEGSEFDATYYGSNGVQLGDYSTNLYVRSFGSNAEEASYFSVGTKNVYIDGGLNAGLNLLRVKKLTGSFTFKNIRMNTAQSNDSLVNFLNTFDSTYYLMLVNSAYTPGGVYLSAAAKNKLKQFGSVYCDSIGLLGYFHTWSFIGSIGSSGSQVSESFDPCCRPAPHCVSCDHWTEAVSNKDVIFRKTSGTVTNVFGPAQSWSDLSWSQTLYPNTGIKFDVYGIAPNNSETLLLSDVQTSTFTDLSSINAYQYPKLKIVSKLVVDTTVGLNSPVLNSIRVNYTPPAELTSEVNSLKTSSSYKVGDELKYFFNYHNPGFITYPGMIVNVYKKSVGVSNLLTTDTTNLVIGIDSLKQYKGKIDIPYFRDSMKVIIEMKLKGSNNETYGFNNNLEFSMQSVQVASPVNLNVYTDGHILNNGDYVAPAPEIKINLSGSEISGSLTSDTTQLLVNLNNRYIPYYVNGSINSAIRILETDNTNPSAEKSMVFYPHLENGNNRITFIYSVNADNRDSISYDVFVSGELAVKDLYNYPNPMRGETNFIFNLAGSVPPSKFMIKIYTVSGKLIRQLEQPVSIGFNQIPWDGRDQDGDLIANGTYLYKLVTDDEANVVTQTQKLVVLR